jgi:signal transduction histidine kinase
MGSVPLRLRPTSLEATIRHVVSLMEPQAEYNRITLKANIAPDLPPVVTIDEDKIAWMLGTLVGNALRHVTKGSFFHPGGEIAVRAAAESGDVLIEVSDDGPGIPADKLPQLFNPPLDKRPFGYALPLARDIVEAHGGRLDVQSSEAPVGHGTTVRIVLPR